MCLSHHFHRDDRRGEGLPLVMVRESQVRKQDDVLRCSPPDSKLPPFSPSVPPSVPLRHDEVRPAGPLIAPIHVQNWFMLGGRSGQTRVGISLLKVSLNDRAASHSHRPYLPHPPPCQVAQQPEGLRGTEHLSVDVVSNGCSCFSRSLSVLIFWSPPGSLYHRARLG